jgi:NADPH-dependent curcumin reductase CurA
MHVTAVTSRQYLLVSRPTQQISSSDLQLTHHTIPALQENQALARVKYFSIDPTMRVWMSDIPQYMSPVAIGSVMRSLGLAEIVESRHPQLKPGDKITGLTGLQEYFVITNDEFRHFQKLPHPALEPDSLYLGLLGMTGCTAYFGMELALPKSSETLVVSAAAGATGSVAGQIGKIQGCRVVGIAGSAEKCRWLLNDLNFDHAINYKDSNWQEQLAAATPNGIDIDFENVGGPVMRAVLQRMNLHGRVILCGLISNYNNHEPVLENFSRILVKRLRVQGFIISDYLPRFPEAIRQLAAWKQMSKLKDRETIVRGFENLPAAINMLFTGQNTGKLLVQP